MKVHACLLFCAVLHAELAAWLTAYLQNWTVTRIWNFTGLILWMQWTALLPGQSSRARFTCSMRDRNQSWGQLKEHLAVPIQAWYFKRPRPWTSTVSPCFIFFMQTSHFLARMARNIQSTVHNLHIWHNLHNLYNNVKVRILMFGRVCPKSARIRTEKNWIPVAWLPIYVSYYMTPLKAAEDLLK